MRYKQGIEELKKEFYNRTSFDQLNHKISIRGNLALMRSDQYMILAKHYPTQQNPHHNLRFINYCIKHSNKEQYI